MLYEINRHYYQRSLFPVCDPKKLHPWFYSMGYFTVEFIFISEYEHVPILS